MRKFSEKTLLEGDEEMARAKVDEAISVCFDCIW